MNRIEEKAKEENVLKQMDMTQNSIKAMKAMSDLKDEFMGMTDDELQTILLDDKAAERLMADEKYEILRELEDYYKSGKESDFPVDLELLFIAGYEPDYPIRLAKYVLDNKGDE